LALSVLFELSEYENAFIETFEFSTSDATPEADLSFISELDELNYWTYMGSDTRPPCEEGVRHVILKKIQPIAADQLERFTNQVGKSEFAKGGNNRVI